ncbi:MAG: hypothetical protein AABX12_00525 [Nanoarchaeota archaeon]
MSSHGLNLKNETFSHRQESMILERTQDVKIGHMRKQIMNNSVG